MITFKQSVYKERREEENPKQGEWERSRDGINDHPFCLQINEIFCIFVFDYCIMWQIVRNTEQFVLRARETHGNKYDYSKADYLGVKISVVITCPTHGDFLQKPIHHFKGHGCHKCGLVASRKKPDKATPTKICKRCKKEFPRTTEYFHKNTRVYDGLRGSCKECVSEIGKSVSKEKWAKVKASRPPIPPRLTEEEIQERKKLQYEKWKANGGLKAYNKKKLQDPQYRMANNLRQQIWVNLKSTGIKKDAHTNEMLGCSWTEFKGYLMSLFTEGMTWDNYGANGWWVDHIVPCAYFDLTDKEQRKACFHYTNLQPMWWRENIQKGSLYEGEKHYRKDKNKSSIFVP